MKGKRTSKKDQNVILYPGLVKRLIEEGMSALKKKDAQTAYDFFASAEEHEPNHPQVRIGKVLSLVEMGQLEQAKEQTSLLLREDIGNYYENLQVHISLLVQLGRYQEVVSLLDAVLTENRIPSQYAESFYQLLHFSRQMIDDKELLAEAEAELEEAEEVSEKVLLALSSEQVERQAWAIQQLRTNSVDEVVQALIAYIEDETHDLLLRSLALQALRTNRVSQPIHIKKLGRSQTVSPDQIDDIFDLKFGQEVVERLSEKLEHENPLLYEMANQLCWAHIYALYPFLPEPSEPDVWTVVFFRGLLLNGWAWISTKQKLNISLIL